MSTNEVIIIMENNKERNYVVYKHTSPSGKCYIGITGQKAEVRWQNGNGYRNNEYFSKAIRKYGWKNIKHEILYSNLTKEEAEFREKELISFYMSNNRNYGYNISSGNHGIGSHSEETKEKIRKAKQNITEETRIKISKAHKGKVISEETKNKISKSMTGEKNHFYGKHHTYDAKKKISESHIGLESKLKGVPKTKEHRKKLSESAKNRFSNQENHPMFGNHHTDESRQKMRNSHKGLRQSEEHRKHNGESHKKPIIQLSRNFEFIRKWDSATDAAREIGGFSTSITACCNGRLKTAYGFIWRYADDENNEFRKAI